MTQHIFILFVIILTSCGTSPNDKKIRNPQLNMRDTITTNIKRIVLGVHNQIEETTDDNYSTYFVVIADTSADYYYLHKKMFDLNRQLNIPIDTMGRFYNKTKNLIALPDNDEDEIYAGDYFPRRFPSDNLSLEYLNFYQKKAEKKTIALITGIYETEKSSDSALAVLYKIDRKAFKMKADIYVGCMH